MRHLALLLCLFLAHARAQDEMIPLGTEVDGRTWGLKILPNGMYDGTKELRKRSVHVRSRLHYGKAPILNLDYRKGYRITLTCNNQKVHLWHSAQSDAEGRHYLPDRLFGTAKIYGLEVGKSYSWEAVAETVEGHRFRKSGTWTVRAASIEEKRRKHERESRTLLRYESELREASPGTVKHLSAESRYVAQLCEEVKYLIDAEGRSPGAVLSHVKTIHEFTLALRGRPKPADHRPQRGLTGKEVTWEQSLESLIGKAFANLLKVYSAASDLRILAFASRAAAAAEAMSSWEYYSDATRTAAGIHRQIAHIRYGCSRDVKRTRQHLEHWWRLLQLHRRESGQPPPGEDNRVDWPAEIESQPIPRDRDELQQQICRTVERLTRSSDRANWQTAKAELEKLCEQLRALPVPADSRENHRWKQYRRYWQRLAASFPTWEEQTRSIHRYNDRVYVEKDGTVHGNPGEAFMHAMGASSSPSSGRIITMDKALSLAAKVKSIQLMGSKITDVLKKFAEPAWEQFKLAGLYSEALVEMAEVAEKLNLDDPKHIRKLVDLGYKARDLGKVAYEAQALDYRKLEKIIAAVERLPSSDPYKVRLLDHLNELHSFASAGPMYQAFTTVLTKGLRSITVDQIRKLSPMKALERWKNSAKGASTKVKIGGIEKFCFVLSLVRANAERERRIASGMDPWEAAGRSSGDLLIDATFIGFPLLGAIDFATFAGSWLFSATTGIEVDATASEIAKRLAKYVYDAAADLGSYIGSESRPGDVQGLDSEMVRVRLALVECRLAAAKPGELPEEEARLLSMRRAFRVYLRSLPPTLRRDGDPQFLVPGEHDLYITLLLPRLRPPE